MSRELGKKILAQLSVDSLFLTSPANMRYVAGFTGEGYVYLSKEKGIVVTDSRYTIAAGEECPGYQVVEWDKKGYYSPLISALKEDGAKDMGVEDSHMTLRDFHKLENQLKEEGLEKIEIKEMENRVSVFRSRKTGEEIEKIRQAEAIGDRAFARLIPELRLGMTEKQVAARLEFYMKEERAEGFSFDTIAASGVHSAMPHAVPTDKVLEEGDFLTMDFGCLYKGYCSDMTRTVVMGKASDEQKKVYETVLKAQETALQGIRPGMTGKEVDALAREVIEKAGYGKQFGHSLGHSVGLEIHEKPLFSSKEETVIQPGMVITVEPGIYIEGFGGVRIEDVVVITEDGCENITHSPKNLIERQG
jgi:Xaa-Pro aminopeptidase